jgi:hypothetical protein
MAEMEIKIDEADLARELAEHSSKLVYAAEQAVKVSLQYEEFKLKVDELYALLDRDTRAAAELAGKKITEKVVENTILLNEDYQKASRHLIQLKAQADIMRYRKEAWRERGSMLVQLSTNRRAEMEALTFDTVREKVA